MKQIASYVVIGALLVLYVFKSCERDPELLIPPTLADTIAINKRWSAHVDSMQVASDSIQAALQRLAQSQADRARNSERATQIAKRGRDSLKTQLDSALSAPDSIPVYVAIVEKQDSIIVQQDSTIGFQKSRIQVDSVRLSFFRLSLDSMTFDRDRWRASSTRLEGVLGVAERRLAAARRFPSKTESFLGGVVTGALLLIALANIGG